MLGIRSKHFQNAFKFVCLTAAVSMIIYCTNDFLENNNISEVSFLRFNQDEESIYPQLTICLLNEFSLLDDKLKQLGKGINTSSYIRFLKGEIWDNRMVGLDIEEITIKLKGQISGR